MELPRKLSASHLTKGLPCSFANVTVHNITAMVSTACCGSELCCPAPGRWHAVSHVSGTGGSRSAGAAKHPRVPGVLLSMCSLLASRALQAPKNGTEPASLQEWSGGMITHMISFIATL